MKRLFLIIPPVLLFGIFVFFYNGHTTEMEQRKEETRIAQEKKDKEEEARKQKLREQAQIEADRQKKELADKILKIEEDARNKREEDERKIVAETESALAENRRLAALITKLQKDIQGMRVARDKAQKDAIETKLDIERSRIEKRNSELEIQRFTDMLATRIKQSTLLAQQDVANAGKKK